jgi:hypothetical protein
VPTLIVGSADLLDQPVQSVRLVSANQVLAEVAIGELAKERAGALDSLRESVREVQIGYDAAIPLDFLRWFPLVTTVWIKSPKVTDITGLQSLPRLEDLAIDRPRCRYDILGTLSGLRKLYLDGWRPGAESISHLRALLNLGVQSWGEPDLLILAEVPLTELWINAGKLERLEGAPETLVSLRLTSQRHLTSLSALSRCRQLARVRLEGCRQIRTLDGLQLSQPLREVALSRSGPLTSLSALERMQSLERLVLIEGSVARNTDISALYTLPSLRELIIPRATGVDAAKLRRVARRCSVTLTATG